MSRILSVPEAAALMSLSSQRVRALIASGGILGARVGGRWVVDETSVRSWLRSGEPGARSRPLSARSVAVLVDLLSQQFGEPPGIAWAYARDHDHDRAHDRLVRLKHAGNPGDILRSWAGRRADRRLVRYAGDPHELIGGAAPVGASHPHSGLAPSGYVELACLPEQAPGFIAANMLHTSENWNVILHVREQPTAMGWLPFDLAAYAADREDAVVERLFA